ncbi:hypothetical protein LJC08_02185 [Methanimicrococcus sp. OttesenSCG-928-J09]|nr:hypothetical protein [Methanimicrococcus sp. OttesenSCG-928-J09]
MASNFTTGIPEIDRLTGSKIGNGSFLLVSGNDDEGMSAFLAEIEKSNGRSVGEEKPKANGCVIQKVLACGEITAIEARGGFNKPQKIETFSQPESERAEKVEKAEKAGRNGKTENAENTEKIDNELEIILFIENISELFQNQKPLEKYSVKTIENRIVSFIEEMKKEIEKQNDKENIHQSTEGVRYIIIGCLHKHILSKRTENRLIHLSDSYFQFKMKERNGNFEREIRIYKYKSNEVGGAGGAGGNILKYTIESGKIQIENKKRIY